ncbi:MAG: hypothetical protein QOI50_536 [Pseudonocardiales bacterium]|jgi:uncharacterized membrane protein YdbT with pleckstrin-like domain|nr:hypothetical protein [Pseudonocardiales bacterium]MDT7592266.1 hypothetical protein [Pseudonocardiales bacterium]MDT7608490.1 hypothetical protein [Pseudonocardiales bacterium]MDT7626024.1 hypothetical protein [Pseudonocardiales bacterium]MDT7628606.1 hypothetical protein [Pseudonocardiales bacterium]
MIALDIDDYILPTERRILRVRGHWALLVKDILESALAMALLMAVDAYLPSSQVIDTLTWYAGLVVTLRLTILVLDWWIERIVITDKRVMMSTGIITHRVAMMPLRKVTDLTFQQTVIGRTLGYGTMVVESAGQIQGLNRIEYMPQPDEIYEALTEMIFGEKKQTRSHLLPKPRR